SSRTTAIGANAEAGGGADGLDDATAVGESAKANAIGASAFGQGAEATGDGAVALGQGSVADQANTVSVGAAGAERRIVNVADGTVATDSTDAVTGGQLYDTNQNVVTNTANILTTNSRMAAALGGGAGVD